MGTVQKDKIFIPHVEMDLAAIGITGEPGYNPVDGNQSVWVDYQFKELLEANNIPYWDDPFDYILAHLESVLVQNLDLFVDIYFCTSYLYDVEEQHEPGNLVVVSEAAKNIRTDQALLPLFYQLMKGLVNEKVPLVNKPVIVQTFIEAKDKDKGSQ
jgi:flagellar biosynthesis component FlhA